MLDLIEMTNRQVLWLTVSAVFTGAMFGHLLTGLYHDYLARKASIERYMAVRNIKTGKGARYPMGRGEE